MLLLLLQSDAYEMRLCVDCDFSFERVRCVEVFALASYGSASFLCTVNARLILETKEANEYKVEYTPSVKLSKIKQRKINEDTIQE